MVASSLVLVLSVVGGCWKLWKEGFRLLSPFHFLLMHPLPSNLLQIDLINKSHSYLIQGLADNHSVKNWFLKNLEKWAVTKNFIISTMTSYWNCTKLKKAIPVRPGDSDGLKTNPVKGRLPSETGLTFSFTLPPSPPSVSDFKIEKVKARRA